MSKPKINPLVLKPNQVEFLKWILEFKLYKVHPINISRIKSAISVNEYWNGMQSQSIFNKLRLDYLKEYEIYINSNIK